MIFSSNFSTGTLLSAGAERSGPTPGSVHLWWANLARGESEIGRFHDLLSPSERDRTARFRTADSRRRFVTARGILRTLLGSYLDEDPAEVPLAVGDFGKPQLKGNRPALHFNISHADDLAVYAFAGDCKVGVDLEPIHEVVEWQDIATSFFDASVTANLEELDGPQRASTFMNAWTRHEALLKAQGRGLGSPPPANSAKYSFCPIEPPAGFAAALAIAGLPALVVDNGFLRDACPMRTEMVAP